MDGYRPEELALHFKLVALGWVFDPDEVKPPVGRGLIHAYCADGKTFMVAQWTIQFYPDQSNAGRWELTFWGTNGISGPIYEWSANNCTEVMQLYHEQRAKHEAGEPLTRLKRYP